MLTEEKEETRRSGARFEEEAEEESFFKRHEFILSFLVFFVFIALMVLLFGGKITLVESCGDGSTYNSCSEIKPYYCDNGILLEKASVCGCDEFSNISGDSCIFQYQIEPKNTNLNYLLDGKEGNIWFTVYGGLTDHLTNESRVISYQSGQKPERIDFELKILNNEQQRQLLLPLVVAIQNRAKDKTNQARIAISIVQDISYGFTNKTSEFFGQTVNYSRYPYEVLYDSQGICGEKSELLAFLLREIGYKTALFYNQQENHQAVGIGCPMEESYWKTGYCFVETTGPAIISDDEIEYVGSVFLESQPEVIPISEGISLPRDLPEYRDAEIMKSIRKRELFLFRNFELNRLKEKYGLVEEYNLA